MSSVEIIPRLAREVFEFVDSYPGKSETYGEVSKSLVNNCAHF